jgi:O-antigen ligase
MWLLLRRQWKLLLAAATAGVAAVAWYSAALMKSFGFIYAKELAAVQGQSGTQRIFAGRMYVWQDMLDRWRELSLPRKLLGSGEVALGAHNDYLQILFHGGIVGLALYVALLSAVLLVVLRQLRRQNDAFATIAAMALLMWLVDTIGLVPSAYSGYQWFVWGVIGLCLRQRLQGEPAPQPVAAMPATRFTNLMGVN